MEKADAVKLINRWADRIKDEMGVAYAQQARWISVSPSTFTAVRLENTRVKEETLVRILEGLANQFPILHKEAEQHGVSFDPPEYTRDELVRLLRDKIRRLQEENDELIDQLEKKGIAPPD